MCDLLAGGRPRCPVHDVIIVWADYCTLCWPDPEDWAASNRPPPDPMSDEDAECIERCLIRIDAQHKAETN